MRRAAVATLVAATFALAGCAPPRAALAECPTMPVKGWEALLAKSPIDHLAHRRDLVLDPLTGTSQMLLADENIAYEVLLTFVFAHPNLGRTPDGNTARCVRDVSLMARVPLEGMRGDAVSAFTAFLGERNMNPEMVRAIASARAAQGAFARVGTMGDAMVSAGTIEHGGRGRFFRVEVAAAGAAR